MEQQNAPTITNNVEPEALLLKVEKTRSTQAQIDHAKKYLVKAVKIKGRGTFLHQKKMLIPKSE